MARKNRLYGPCLPYSVSRKSSSFLPRIFLKTVQEGASAGFGNCHLQIKQTIFQCAPAGRCVSSVFAFSANECLARSRLCLCAIDLPVWCKIVSPGGGGGGSQKGGSAHHPYGYFVTLRLGGGGTSESGTYRVFPQLRAVSRHPACSSATTVSVSPWQIGMTSADSWNRSGWFTSQPASIKTVLPGEKDSTDFPPPALLTLPFLGVRSPPPKKTTHWYGLLGDYKWHRPLSTPRNRRIRRTGGDRLTQRAF